MDNKKYDIALSFAGEQREYAEELANKLSQKGLKVFLDFWDVSNTWGRDLTSYFASVFPQESLYVVAIFSKEYNEKAWPKFEFEIMQERQMQEEEFILPIAYDGSFPNSWPRTRGFIDKNQFSLDEIVNTICEKVWSRKHKTKGVDLDNELLSSESKKTMTIIGLDGTAEQVEVIIAFRFKDTGKEFIVYTKNERDGHGYVDVFVSRVDRSSGETKIYHVDDEDWIKVKEVLWELSLIEDTDDPTPMPSVSLFSEDGIEYI